jgi:hypothetical protein
MTKAVIFLMGKKIAETLGQVSAAGSPFATTCGPTPPMADKHTPWCISIAIKPISR